MLFGFDDMKFIDYFTSKASITTRGNDYELFVNYPTLYVRKHFFSERIIIWNNLNFISIKRLKTSILSVIQIDMHYCDMHTIFSVFTTIVLMCLSCAFRRILIMITYLLTFRLV